MSTSEVPPRGRKWNINVRAGTWDQAIFEGVIRGEYGRPQFAGKIVVDVGAHIGAFSVLAALGGARRVLAFEAGADNYALLVRNCADFPAIECRQAAVWRSDAAGGTLRWCPSTNPENTGGGTVLECEGIAGTALTATEARDVPWVPFDDIVSALGIVDILKIDAEGSEYPILLTSRRLGQVREIVGEYHEVTGLRPAMEIPGVPEWTMRHLGQHLAENGFSVKVRVKEHLGLFHATRRPPPDAEHAPAVPAPV